MAKQKKDILIANPMFDVVFKLLMSDKEIARYFVGTVLDEEITDIDFAPQEYQYEKQKLIKNENQIKKISTVRLDFVATIRTTVGDKKKILIEIQQSLKPYDILRFRTYIGEQYTNKENIEDKEDKLVNVMPIVVIYMFGFKIAEIPQIAIKIKRTGDDIIGGGKVAIKNPIFEALTHDAYFIQVSRIEQQMYEDWKKCSELMKLLSIFEQNYFTDKKYIKKYPYPITNKKIKKMVRTLERVALDTKTRRAMQEEEFAALDLAFFQDALAKERKANITKDKALAKALATKDKELATERNALAKALARIAELERKNGIN